MGSLGDEVLTSSCLFFNKNGHQALQALHRFLVRGAVPSLIHLDMCPEYCRQTYKIQISRCSRYARNPAYDAERKLLTSMTTMTTFGTVWRTSPIHSKTSTETGFTAGIAAIQKCLVQTTTAVGSAPPHMFQGNALPDVS